MFRFAGRLVVPAAAHLLCVCVWWQNVVSAVEEREHDQGRQELHRGLTSAKSEADLLRAELAEVLLYCRSSFRATVDQRRVWREF